MTNPEPTIFGAGSDAQSLTQVVSLVGGVAHQAAARTTRRVTVTAVLMAATGWLTAAAVGVTWLWLVAAAAVTVGCAQRVTVTARRAQQVTDGWRQAIEDTVGTVDRQARVAYLVAATIEDEPGLGYSAAEAWKQASVSARRAGWDDLAARMWYHSDRLSVAGHDPAGIPVFNPC